MYISIGNSIGSSSNSGSVPTPEFTRYVIRDCVTDGDYYNTLEYEWGTFNINDRVVFNKTKGIPTFGKIDSYTTEVGDDINPNATGVNSANCFNNNLVFTSVLFIDGTTINIKFYCNPSNGNFVYNADIDSYLIYNYNLYIYYEGFNGDGDPVSDTINISGQSNEIGNYNFIQGDDNLIFEINENIGDTITFSYIDEGQEQPYFAGTQQYSDNNNCSYNYFLQNETGYSFVGIARQDNC